MRALGIADLPGSDAAAQQDALDWNALGAEAVELLRQYVRIPTVNDPGALSAPALAQRPWEAGGEAEAAAWLAKLLRAEGIEAQLLESAPRRTNLVARLRGRQPGGAVTLLSHSDVVPAQPAQWSCDPFGGEIRDGYLYGRGTLDLKGLGIVHLLTLVAIKRMRVPLERDLVLLVVADEETGGRYGTEWLLAQRPDLLDSAVVLGEGAYSVDGLLPNGRTVHAVAVGEKGYLEIELCARADGGHASLPAADNAPRRLVRALDAVLSIRLPMRLTPLTRALLGTLAQASRGLHGLLLRNPRLLARLAPDALADSALVNGMVRDTIAATVLQAGGKHNVMPAEARAILSIRLLPETDADALAATVAGMAARHGVETRRLLQKAANASPFDTWTYRTLERQLRRHDRDGVAMPILSPAASDCRFFRARGIASYGWIPFVIPAADLHRVHGADERVSLAALRGALRCFVEAVLALALAPRLQGDGA